VPHVRTVLIALALAATLLAAACGGSRAKPTPTALPSATATAGPTVTPATTACDQEQVTYRGETVRVADSDGAGNPGLEMRVYASAPAPCVLRRGGVGITIGWYPNRAAQKLTPSGLFDLLPHPRGEINAYLPEAAPVARFLWKNSCTVNDASVRLLVDTVAFYDERMGTASCAAGAADAATDLVLLAAPLSGPTPPSLERPIPAGYSDANIDLTNPATLKVVVSAAAPDDGRACEKLFPWMVPPGAPASLATKVASCAFAGYGRPHFVAKPSDPTVLYLWRAEVLLPALAGLPGQRLNSSCEEEAQWLVPATAAEDTAAFITVCDARVVADPRSETGTRIWAYVFANFINDVPPDAPCWQLSAYLGTFAGEGRAASVQCVMY
jgi:hypothetical protein